MLEGSLDTPDAAGADSVLPRPAVGGGGGGGAASG
jgi:hypothetical protein